MIISFKSFEENIEHVRKVFQRLKKNGIKLKAKKCDLFKKEVKYLGQLVSQEGYCANPDNIKPTVSLKKRTPKTVGEVRPLTSLSGYYQRYIENFFHVAKPIYDLLKYDPTCPPSKRQPPKEKGRPKKKTHQVWSSTPVSWSEEHQGDLNVLTDCLTCSPVMVYPDYEIPLLLHTDASQEGFCASLYQNQQGRKNACNWICLKSFNTSRNKVSPTLGQVRILSP